MTHADQNFNSGKCKEYLHLIHTKGRDKANDEQPWSVLN
jgi:hypothetical protein